MKIGDIVVRCNQLGIITRAEADGHTVHFRYGLSFCGSGVTEDIIALTAEQRAIVNAAIAAEALRRIG